PQRPHGDCLGRQLLFFCSHLRVPLLHFRQRRCHQLVQQIVRFDTKAFASAHFHIGLLGLFGRKLVAHFRGTSRRQRHYFIRQVNPLLRLFPMPQRSPPRRPYPSQTRLPCVNHAVTARCRLATLRCPRISRPTCCSPNRWPPRRIRP